MGFLAPSTLKAKDVHRGFRLLGLPASTDVATRGSLVCIGAFSRAVPDSLGSDRAVSHDLAGLLRPEPSLDFPGWRSWGLGPLRAVPDSWGRHISVSDCPS